MWQTAGFNPQKEFFSKLFLAPREGVSPAYLLTGPEMIGKKTFVLELAGRLNKDYSSAVASPDFWFWGEEKAMPIEEVRNLKKFLRLRSYHDQWRIVVLDRAESWQGETANALLKILEEPPSGVLFFLIAAQGRALLPTISSRCLEVKFAPHDQETIRSFLRQTTWGKKLNTAQVDFLAGFSNGQLGLICRWQEQGLLNELKPRLETFGQLLLMPVHQRLALADNILKNKKLDPLLLLKLWMLYLHSPFSANLKINRPRALRCLLETSVLLSRAQINQRLALENLLLNLT